MYIVSACLTGENCRYDGGNNRIPGVETFLEENIVVSICPEILGGLETPRSPAEIVGDKVINKDGEDVTEQFLQGATRAITEIEKMEELYGGSIKGAILKSKSPSCGCGCIYDGSFSKSLISGDGLFTKLLKDRNIPVFTEMEMEKIITGGIDEKL